MVGVWHPVVAGMFITTLLVVQPAHAGPPFRTDDPEPPEPGHLEVILFSQGALADGGWSGVLPASEVNYGAAPGLQLHALVQQGFTAPANGSAGFAVGDLELGAKYRFINPGLDDWYPQVAIYPAIEIPIGNQKLGFSTGHARIFLPVWLQKDWGPWTVYGGGGYWFNPGSGNRDYVFLGVALWRKITDRLNLGFEVFNQTSPSRGIPGGAGFDAGLTYDLSDAWHVLTSAGRGFDNTFVTNQFSFYLGLQLTI